MAFLDNSGDIILDAVLTDTGRARLARGDGTFKIAKYALADDEIDYSLYNPDHASGSSHYDLDIMMTPILEAFTNNVSSMKSKLISIPRTNLQYLPTLRLNEDDEHPLNKTHTTLKTFIVAVDSDTEDAINSSYRDGNKGVLLGVTVTGQSASHIRIDQGLENTALSGSSRIAIDPDLKETQYIVEIDNRFGSIASQSGSTFQFNFLDDDQVASYYFSSSSELVTDLVPHADVNNSNKGHVILGPKGTTLKLHLRSSTQLRDSTYLFEQFGNTADFSIDGSDVQYKYIDSIVRVTGATTGSSIDIPVRFVKIAAS
jgi:hypothetical protein